MSSFFKIAAGVVAAATAAAAVAVVVRRNSASTPAPAPVPTPAAAPITSTAAPAAEVQNTILYFPPYGNVPRTWIFVPNGTTALAI